MICLILINFFNYIKCSDLLGIINGDVTQENEALFFVAISKLGGRPFCGGTLYAKNKVLTAAHCFHNDPILQETYLVKYGTKVRKSDLDMRNSAYITRIELHPHYDEKIFYKIVDIAVATLSINISKSQNVTYAEFETDEVNVGDKITLYGFGPIRMIPYKTYSDKLRKAEFNLIEKRYNRVYFNNSRQMTCNGDSGGPLVTRNGKIFAVHKGTVICDYVLSKFEGVGTELKQYRNWINAQ